MSKPTETHVPATKEKTFTSFSQAQGTNSLRIAQATIQVSTKLSSVLDVGCGPGITVRELAPLFAFAMGIDPSEGMIKNGRLLGGTSSTAEPIRFEVATAEDLGSHLLPPIEDSSVDLITAATAAHVSGFSREASDCLERTLVGHVVDILQWFDMERFWPSAARVLKPGGTIAFWTVGPVRIHESTPNSVAIQKAVDDIEETEFKPFFEPGNLLTQALFVDLPLPWTLLPGAAGFDKGLFFRKEWGPENSGKLFAGGALMADMDRLEKVMSTMSPVQRWREAHPDTAGTERDVVRRMRLEIEQLMHEAGVEEGREVVQGNLSGVLLLLKRQ